MQAMTVDAIMRILWMKYETKNIDSNECLELLGSLTYQEHMCKAIRRI